jgi:copper(I)-binding protein
MKPLRLCLLLCTLPAWACHGLTASDAWIREAAPGAEVLAGYVTLTNPGEEAQDICHAQSEIFGSVEFHQMSMDHGKMQMRQLDKLAVPAHGNVTLEPGATHLMLMQPKKPLQAGQKVRIEFYCGQNDKLSIEFKVRRAS